MDEDIKEAGILIGLFLLSILLTYIFFDNLNLESYIVIFIIALIAIIIFRIKMYKNKE